TSDALCPNGLFDPSDPSVGLDWRTRIHAIGGRSVSDVWLAGALGTMAHFDGSSWTPSEMGTMESQRVLWLLDSAELSLGSFRSIYARGLDVDAGGVSADGWSHHELPPRPPFAGRDLMAAWAPPGSHSLWLAASTDLWRLRLTPALTFEIQPGIPASVCEVVSCRRMRSIHGISEETVWAVGELGAAIRIDDAETDAPTATSFNTLAWVGLSGVWAASNTDVWAVGGAGTIRHYTGDALLWEVVSDVPTQTNLNAVWGTGPSDVWAVGDAGVVLHYDGTHWSRVKIAGLGERRPDLYTVWSPTPGHVWVGGEGIVLALGGKP
ncbi:MAG: hypothetical protein K0S65_1357, partial [Labilithrix sp.]|nr:hypothetical protein [Labilithrix sp.]